ncbi:hypothetical protein CR513_39206, partial [Mucuna pruriens]
MENNEESSSNNEVESSSDSSHDEDDLPMVRRLMSVQLNPIRPFTMSKMDWKPLPLHHFELDLSLLIVGLVGLLKLLSKSIVLGNLEHSFGLFNWRCLMIYGFVAITYRPSPGMRSMRYARFIDTWLKVS